MSARLVQRTMSAGRLSIVPFQTFCASSYSVSLGRSNAPCTRVCKRCTVAAWGTVGAPVSVSNVTSDISSLRYSPWVTWPASPVEVRPHARLCVVSACACPMKLFTLI